jgi:hypothetical protein
MLLPCNSCGSPLEGGDKGSSFTLFPFQELLQERLERPNCHGIDDYGAGEPHIGREHLQRRWD